MANSTRLSPNQIDDSFGLTALFSSYVSKPEITDISPSFVVKGSKNVLIDYAQRVISRNGYTLYNQTNTGLGGIKGSFDWSTSTGRQFNLRSYDKFLEFDWLGSYNQLLSSLATPYLEFTTLLDFNEQIDILLFVQGDGNVYRWSGGTSKVRVSTAATLTKQGVLSGTTFAFVAGTTGTIAPTITDSANNFVAAGFAAGDTLFVTGSVANSRQYTIGSVAAGTITLIMSNSLVSEAAGPAVVIHNGEPTWKSSRFFSSISPRSIMYQGISYTYTGGESTDTLTGLTAFPAVTVGDKVWQSVDSYPLSSAITTPFPTFFPDRIATQINQLVLASSKSAMAFGSSATDYTNFSLTSPRAPGDPFQKPLSSGPCNCIIPINSDAQTLNVQSNFLFQSGTDVFDKIDFHMSADNSQELLRIIQYKTAVGSGIISKSALCPVKNATVYISRDPALDYLGNLELPEGRRNVPLSDPIKDDFDSYDFTDCDVIYWKRSLFISLPNEGLVLIYDLMRNLWQPPQTIPVGKFAIINDMLYGHCAVTNETYQLFVGTNDNGVFIPQVARFAYNNGGRRDRLKNLSEYWSDGYITPNGVLNYSLNLGFAGSEGIALMQILGTDANVTSQEGAIPLGEDPLGFGMLGGSSPFPLAGIIGTNSPMLRFWQIDTATLKDYIEHYVEYTMDTMDGQFAIVAHGSNQFDAGTSPIVHKK